VWHNLQHLRLLQCQNAYHICVCPQRKAQQAPKPTTFTVLKVRWYASPFATAALLTGSTGRQVFDATPGDDGSTVKTEL
jgi:hypothetical protein